MAFPATSLDVTVEAAFGADLTAAPGTWSWTDLTSRARVADGIQVKVGKPDEASFTPTTELKLGLTGTDGALSPFNPASTYWPNVVIDTPIRITVNEAGGGVRTLCFVDQWLPTGSSATENDCVVKVTASGLRRRLSQGRPNKSALRRTILADTVTPLIAYSLEDGAEATAPLAEDGTAGVIAVAEAFQPGRSDMLGTPALYGVTAGGGEDIGSQLTGVGLYLPIPAHTSTGVEIITMHLRWDPLNDSLCPDDVKSVFLTHRIDFRSGTIPRVLVNLQVTASSPTGVAVEFMGQFGDLFDTITSHVVIEDGNWHEVQIRLVQSGGDVIGTLYVDGVLEDTTTTLTTQTLGTTKAVILGAAGDYDTNTVIEFVKKAPFEAAWVMVHTDNAVGRYTDAMTGYPGEHAHKRLARLGAEENIPMSVMDESFVAVGTASHASNANVTPGIPAGAQAGDLMVMLAAIRNAGAGVPSTPTGWTRLAVFDTASNVQVFEKVHSGSESAPTVSFTGGVANATTSAQIAAFRNVSTRLVAAAATTNASQANVDYPACSVTEDNALVLYVGWKQDDWTSVATIAAATEIGEASSTTGDDQGIVWDYLLQGAKANVASGSFVVTGGANAVGAGAVLVLAPRATTRMGPQLAGTFLDLADECAESDGGVLYDGSANGGFTYVSRTERYDLAAALTLTGLMDEQFTPVHNRQGLVTDLTVARKGGSSARYVDTAAQATLNGASYIDRKDLSLYADGDALRQASWRTRLSHITGYRYPIIAWDLADDASIVAAWMATTIGARLAVIGTPSQAGPDAPDVAMIGYTETLKAFSWAVEANCVNFQPYEVYQVAAAGNRGRVDSSTSSLAADPGSGGTSLSVTVTGVLWRTGATSFAADVGGEKVTVTNITGGSSPQTFTVTRSVNGVVKAHAIGTVVKLWRPGAYAL